MAFTEDLTIFFDTDDHAIAGSYTATGASATTVNGILHDAYVEVGGMESVRLVFECATSDVSGAKQDDALTAESNDYLVAEVQPDGTGVTVLILKNA